jgi:hypothetical protein
MRDDQYRDIATQLLAKRRLNYSVRRCIDSRCCLVEDEKLAAADHRTRKRDHLLRDIDQESRGGDEAAESTDLSLADA